MILSDHSMCMIPHQGTALPLFSLSLMRLSVELRVGDEKGACLYCIFCKVKDWIQRRKQVVQSDQDMHVCGIF